MATLKKNKSKRKQKVEVEEIVKSEETAEKTEYLNKDEQAALAEQHEKDTADEKNVSFKKMELAVQVAQSEFNLADKDYSVTGFADKGSKCQLSMSNDDFDVVITIKDTEKFGIH